MNGLGERDFAAMKIMLFLTGNAEGFGVAEKTILERCNISESAYKKARKKLVDKGWITHKPGEAIIVNYNTIFKGYTDNTSSNSMGYTENTSKGCTENTPLGITENTHNNIRNNINNNIIIDEPIEEEVEVEKPIGEISSSQLKAMGCVYETLEDNLIKFSTGKIFRVIE